MKTLSKDKTFLILLKRALLDMSHCTKLKINLENIGNNNNNNKEPVQCEKTLCEHIKIGKQGRAFLKWIHKNLLGQSLSIAGPTPAPPMLQSPLTSPGSSPQHRHPFATCTGVPDPSHCPPHQKCGGSVCKSWCGFTLLPS